MMTRVEYPDASGLNGIEWDFVEVISIILATLTNISYTGRLAIHGELLQ